MRAPAQRPRGPRSPCERRYEAVDDNRDVDPDGTIKAGALVRVRLTLVVPTTRYQVALVDPLPAGLEVVNPALGGSVHPTS